MKPARGGRGEEGKGSFGLGICPYSVFDLLLLLGMATPLMLPLQSHFWSVQTRLMLFILIIGGGRNIECLHLLVDHCHNCAAKSTSQANSQHFTK